MSNRTLYLVLPALMGKPTWWNKKKAFGIDIAFTNMCCEAEYSLEKDEIV